MWMLTLDSDVKACSCSDNLSLFQRKQPSGTLLLTLLEHKCVPVLPFHYCVNPLYREMSLHNKLTDWAPPHIEHAEACDCVHLDIWLCDIFRGLFISPTLSLTGWDSWQLQLGCAEAFHWQSGPGWSPANGGGQPALRKFTKPVSNRPWWFWRVFWGWVSHSQPDPLSLTASNAEFGFLALFCIHINCLKLITKHEMHFLAHLA